MDRQVQEADLEVDARRTHRDSPDGREQRRQNIGRPRKAWQRS